MNESYTDLPERIRKSFSEIDSDIVVDLRTTSEEYADLFHRLTELKQKCPFIDSLLEESGPISLTEQEHNAVVQAMRLRWQMENLERQHIYFRGHTDAFFYLKEIGAI